MKDKWDAMREIHQLATEAGLAVSIVTADDVLLLKGIDAPTDEQREAVIRSWEFRHYGENWSDWFEGF